MRKIQKHSFEPVSLLTVENGILEVAIIPAVNQPDWLVPKTLILAIESFSERIWTYLWQNQEVSVYHLLPRDISPDKLIVLEGNTDVHRLALQTVGAITYKNVRISDVKDAVLDDETKQRMQEHLVGLPESENNFDYLYQTVSIEGTLYTVPELDLIAHRLVDLDS